MMLLRTILAISFSILCLAPIKGQNVQTRTLTIYPMAESDTPLAPPLLPPVTEQTHGNAAVYYGKVKSEQSALFGDGDFHRALLSAEEKTLEELQQDSALQSKLSGGIFLNVLVAAGRCDSVDWQLPIREVPFLEITLSEIQESRQYARILAARTRFDVAEGNFESAIKFAQANFALARNVGDAPTVLNALVGLGIQDAAARSLIDFIQHPHAPNLYWSLEALPDPLVRTDRASEAERASLELTFPWLADILEDESSAAQWNQRLDRVWEVLRSLGSGRVRDVTLDELVIFGYPIAKRRLNAGGVPSEKLEAMPVAQVLLADMHVEDQKLRQQLLKWTNIPYPKSYSGVVELEQKQMNARGFGLDNLAVATRYQYSNMLMGNTSSQQTMAMLKIVEALRMDAASRGRLPKSLDEISYPPIPSDPVTGKPFKYELNGKKAVLTAGPLRYWGQRWEIELGSSQAE